jgi:Raf kinase inhibitor-like YbhB/YbcL family protein
MQLTSSSFSDGAAIPGDFAFCVPDPATHATLGSNRNPALSWDDVPDGTASYALICVDRTVPTKPDDVNQEGREVPADLPRGDFYHWVLVDVPAELRSIEAGAFADGVVTGGKDAAVGPHGTRQGINDYTSWFAGDEAMGGDYYGYDGPCPPWNDALVHHYHFILYALDVAALDLEDGFTGADVLAAIEGHVLAQAEIVGSYTLNPRLRV